jgi:hypothetical protein
MANTQGFPTIKKDFETDGTTTWEMFTSVTGWIAIGMFIVGLALEFVPGGQALGTALIVDSMYVGAMAAGMSIYDHMQDAEPDKAAIAIDIATLVGTIFASGGRAFIEMYNAGKMSKLGGKVGQFMYFAGASTLVGQGVFISAIGVVQIVEILRSDKPLDEKMAMVSRILMSLALGLWLFARSSTLATLKPQLPKGYLGSLNKTISQKQMRHVQGRKEYRGGGYLNSQADGQKVLNAVHAGEAEFLGTMQGGHQVFRYKGVTGTNVNTGAGILGEASNVFMIKGTTSPSVVPTSPNWAPK